MQVVNTWISGAVRLSIDSGSGNTWLAGAVTYSAKPPLVSRPSSMPFGQRCVCPMRQWKHTPQKSSGSTMARSPGLSVGVAAGFHHFADHLVAHDPRIAHGNRAAVDFEIRAADPAVRDADQNLPLGRLPGAGHLVQRQLVRRRSEPLPSWIFLGPSSFVTARQPKRRRFRPAPRRFGIDRIRGAGPRARARLPRPPSSPNRPATLRNRSSCAAS